MPAVESFTLCSYDASPYDSDLRFLTTLRYVRNDYGLVKAA